METILTVRHLEREYRKRGTDHVVAALRGVNFEMQRGEFVVVMGESGSGKSTLLNIIATLDRPTGGELFYAGQNIHKKSDAELAKYRRHNIGFVFQDYNLLDQFSIADNVRLPMVLEGIDEKEMERRLDHYLRALNIQEHQNKLPYELSGGEQQRVAIARALVMQPELLLADEPTGALDSRNSERLMTLFAKLNEAGQTILFVTHSIKSAAYGRRILFLRDGRICYELYRGKHSISEFREKIADAMTLVEKGENIHAAI